MDGKTFWLSNCKYFGIVETQDGTFDAYYRLYSVLQNRDAMWFPSYDSARRYLKTELGMESRMKKVSKKEYEKEIYETF